MCSERERERERVMVMMQRRGEGVNDDDDDDDDGPYALNNSTVSQTVSPSFSGNQFQVLLLLQHNDRKENSLPETRKFFRHVIFQFVSLSLGLSNARRQKYHPHQSTSPCISQLCHFCMLVPMTTR